MSGRRQYSPPTTLCENHFRFDNLTKAFDFAIVRYHAVKNKDTGSVAGGVTTIPRWTPRAVNLRQYRDHCRSPVDAPPIHAKVSQCTAFIGSYYAIFNLVKRTPSCQKSRFVVPCSAYARRIV